jgi:hypothetical protein
VIKALAATLDDEHDFTTSLRCPAKYILTFTLDDGVKESLGYYCEGDSPRLLKGDTGEWRGRSINASAEFQALFETLMLEDE